MSGGLLAATVLAGLAAAPARAADDDDDTPSNALADKFSNSISNGAKKFSGIFGIGKPLAPPQVANPSGCPTIEILDGTDTQRISVANAAGNAGLRHQFSITDVARECRVAGNRVTLKVGVQGRVLLGPAGAAGTFTVPIRIAVVNRIDGRPAVSKLYSVTASMPTGATSAPYALVADALVVPIEAGHTAQDYAIKVGLDSSGRSEATPARARTRRGHPIAATGQ